jgi:pyrroline-5-carboxylate reductase
MPALCSIFGDATDGGSKEVAQFSSVILLCTKPQAMTEVLQSLAPHVTSEHLVVSFGRQPAGCARAAAAGALRCCAACRPPAVTLCALHLQVPLGVPSRRLLRPGCAPQISVAAGITLQTLESALGEGVRVVRVMPNTPGGAYTP